MICSQCKTQNPIGNKYCRECGVPLAQPSSRLAQEDITLADHERLTERVAGLLSAAFTLSEQKRFDQALPIAEEAVNLLPQSTSALSLLATLLEQTGQTTRAVAVMERVVSLNPESPADRQKLDFLRKKPPISVGTKATPAAPPAAVQPGATSRRIPAWAPALLGGSAAACVFGIWLSMNNQASFRRAAPIAGAQISSAPGSAAEQMQSNVRSEADLAANATPMPPRGGNGIPPADQTRVDPFSSLAAQNNAATAREHNTGAAQAPLPPMRISANRNSRASGNFPAQANNGADPGEPSGTLPPIIAVPPPQQASNGGFGATQSNASGVGAAPVRSNADQGTLEVSPVGGAAPTPTPYIRITVGASGSGQGAFSTRGSSGSGSTSSDSGADALSRARHLQSSGRYSDAITAYQQSLSAGTGNSGEVQQGLGQSYARLGNESAARSAYRDAIRSFQAQSASGHNVAAAERGINACKAALEVLGGE